MTKISPSKESTETLNHPIKVVKRLIPTNATVQKHKHLWGQFIYASKGILSVTTDTERLIVPPEQGVWILPDVYHEVTALTDVELTSFYFDTETLTQLPNENCVLTINHFLKTLILEAQSIKKGFECTHENGLLLKLILHRLANAPKVALQLPYPKDGRLLSILASIQKAPSEKRSLVEWGKTVGASSRTLSRLFKSETGMTYESWRQRLIIQIAINKLSSGELVANVATHLGYESPSAFTYMFKQNTGVIPSNYRTEQI